MAETNKDLLDDQPHKPSILESIVLGQNDSTSKTQKKKKPLNENGKEEILTTELPKSQVLGKVKDFLGVMAKANEELKARGSLRTDYDIEVLSGNEKEYIEMDLLLGVADLNTPEAVAAAEAATAGEYKQPITSTSSSDSEDDSDEDDDISNGDNNTKDDSKPSKRPKIVVLD